MKTETNTRAMARQVITAARALLGNRKFQADFEHGQWWVTDVRSGAQWSVCDATGPDTHNGLCFEQVTEGDDDR